MNSPSGTPRGSFGTSPKDVVVFLVKFFLALNLVMLPVMIGAAVLAHIFQRTPDSGRGEIVSETTLVLFIPVFFILFGGYLFTAIGFMLSYLSGWRTIARQFPAPPAAMEGKRYTWQSGRVGIVNYNNVLRIGVSAQGLSLACGFPFDFIHPPILIPWSQITGVEQKPAWFWKVTTLTIGEPKMTTVTLYNSKIIEAAGSWLVQNEHGRTL